VRAPQTLALHGLLLAGVAVMAFPFLWMLSSSLKSNVDAIRFPPTLVPRDWLWANYGHALAAAPFPRYFLNSLIQSVGVAACVTVTSTLAAYAFVFLEFPGRRALFGAFVFTLLIPPEITLIPNFVVVTALHWYNTFLALIVPFGASVLSIFLLRQVFLGIPRDLYDAARVDGCSPGFFLWRILMPLSGSGLAVVGLLAFLRAWNDLLWPLVATSSDNMRTIQVGLLAFSQNVTSQYNLLMAASVMVVLPTVAAFLLAQRQIIEGIGTTGLRG